MTNDLRLGYVDRLLRQPSLLDEGLWPRSCVWLIRVALERALDEFWVLNAPDVARANRRAQLIVLTRKFDSAVGQRCTYLWNDLSRAAHHHAYELAPTATELRSWHDEATALINSTPLGGKQG